MKNLPSTTLFIDEEGIKQIELQIYDTYWFLFIGEIYNTGFRGTLLEHFSLNYLVFFSIGHTQQC